MADQAKPARWLTVIYRVPSNPSTLRVGIWKQTKELGGLPLQQSVYLLPDLTDVRLGLAQLERQVHQGGGECTILEVSSLDADVEETFVKEFNRSREQEYAEVAEDLEELLRHASRKLAQGRFDRGEIDDAHGDLARARALLEAIAARDYFGAKGQKETTRLAVETQEKLEHLIAQASGRSKVGHETDDEPGHDARAETLGGIKAKVREVLARDQLIGRLREVICELEDGSLLVDEVPVGSFPESAAFEVAYSDRRGKRTLAIEVQW